MKHIRLRLLVASAFTLLVAACSQAPAPQAQLKTPLSPQFGTSNDDTGDHVFASRQTDAVYLTGSLTRFVSDVENNINTDGSLRRYKPDGTLVWKKQFNATTYEDLTDLTEDSEGNIIVALNKNVDDSQGISELFKYTATGQELWRRSLDGVRKVYSIDTTPTGGFYIVGDDSSFRGLIHKYSQDGALLWTKQLARTRFFGPSATDAKGNLYTVRLGSYEDQDVSDSVYKFDRAGKLVWTRLVPKGTANSVVVQDMVVEQDALLLLGLKSWLWVDTEYEAETDSDVAIIKYGLDGKQLWNKSFGTKNFDSGVSIDVDNKRNVYVAAYLDGLESLVLRKYTPAGRTLSQTTIAENLDRENDQVKDMAVRQTGEVYITGQTEHNLGAGFKGGYFDAFLIRLDGEGKQVWVR